MPVSPHSRPSQRPLGPRDQIPAQPETPSFGEANRERPLLPVDVDQLLDAPADLLYRLTFGQADAATDGNGARRARRALLSRLKIALATASP